jgi:hypothetical protein
MTPVLRILKNLLNPNVKGRSTSEIYIIQKKAQARFKANIDAMIK